MSERDLSERDVCTRFITPAIVQGWLGYSDAGEGGISAYERSCEVALSVRLFNREFVNANLKQEHDTGL